MGIGRDVGGLHDALPILCSSQSGGFGGDGAGGPDEGEKAALLFGGPDFGRVGGGLGAVRTFLGFKGNGRWPRSQGAVFAAISTASSTR